MHAYNLFIFSGLIAQGLVHYVSIQYHSIYYKTERGSLKNTLGRPIKNNSSQDCFFIFYLFIIDRAVTYFLARYFLWIFIYALYFVQLVLFIKNPYTASFISLFFSDECSMLRYPHFLWISLFIVCQSSDLT